QLIRGGLVIVSMPKAILSKVATTPGFALQGHEAGWELGAKESRIKPVIGALKAGILIRGERAPARPCHRHPLLSLVVAWAVVYGMWDCPKVYSCDGFDPITDDGPLLDAMLPAIPHARHRDMHTFGQRPNRHLMSSHEPANVLATEPPCGVGSEMDCHLRDSFQQKRYCIVLYNSLRQKNRG